MTVLDQLDNLELTCSNVHIHSCTTAKQEQVYVRCLEVLIVMANLYLKVHVSVKIYYYRSYCSYWIPFLICCSTSFYNVHLIHVTVDIIDNRYRQKQYRRHHEHALTKTALKQTSTNVSSRDRQHSLLTTDTAEQINYRQHTSSITTASINCQRHMLTTPETTNKSLSTTDAVDNTYHM
jgi:hypothetical protein